MIEARDMDGNQDGEVDSLNVSLHAPHLYIPTTISYLCDHFQTEDDDLGDGSRSNSVASSHSQQSLGLSHSGSHNNSGSSLQVNSNYEIEGISRNPMYRRESGSSVSRLSPSVSS